MKRKIILSTSWVNPLSLILILKEMRIFLLLKNIVIIVSFLLVILSLKITTMFGISGILKQRRVWRYPRSNQQYICKVQHVLFALFLFVYVEWCPTLIVLCFWFVCLRLVYPMLLLTRKLLNQRFLLAKLKSSLRTFDLVDRYGISVSQMTTDMFHLS